MTDIRLVPLRAVDLQHARDEGEGHEGLRQWRSAHEGFWHGREFRNALGDPAFTVGDETVVVLERFRVVSTLYSARPRGGAGSGPVR